MIGLWIVVCPQVNLILEPKTTQPFKALETQSIYLIKIDRMNMNLQLQTILTKKTTQYKNAKRLITLCSFTSNKTRALSWRRVSKNMLPSEQQCTNYLNTKAWETPLIHTHKGGIQIWTTPTKALSWLLSSRLSTKCVLASLMMAASRLWRWGRVCTPMGVPCATRLPTESRASSGRCRTGRRSCWSLRSRSAQTCGRSSLASTPSSPPPTSPSRFSTAAWTETLIKTRSQLMAPSKGTN